MSKTTSKIEFSDNDLMSYLKKKKLGNTFVLATKSLFISNGRYDLIQEKIKRYRDLILNPQLYQNNITFDVVKLQITQLDLLSDIFILLEEYLGYGYNLRISLTQFPKSIAGHNRGVIEKELNYLKNLKENDILNYLHLADYSSFPVSKSHKTLIRKNNNKLKKEVYKRIKRILKFYTRYYRIYIKYKHILPAVLGIYGKTYDSMNNKYEIDSHIYIRDYYKNKYTTYIISSTGLGSLNSYQEIAEDIKVVFEILLLSYINRMMNKEHPFLIPVNNYIDVERIDDWKEIIRQVNRFPSGLPILEIKVNTNPSKQKELNKKLNNDNVYQMKKDLFTKAKK